MLTIIKDFSQHSDKSYIRHQKALMRRLLFFPFALCLLWAACTGGSDPIFHPKSPTAPSGKGSISFLQRKPAETGITFVPSITEDYRYNFSIDPYIYNGGGVAVLDVNNDGLQDLLFTARLQGCQLYLNKGGFRFEDISESAGVKKHGGLKTGVVVTDVNADGWADLYIARTWLEPVPERRNLLLINNKDNTFTEAAATYGLDDLSASQHANFFDYDRDGDLDCYVLNQPVTFKTMNNVEDLPGNARKQQPKDAFESDKLYRNDGSHFTDVTREAGLLNRAFGLSSIAADFNEDGWTDLFVGNDFVMPDFLYLNNHDGTFTDVADATFRYTTNHTMGADFADINGDGFSDLLALDMLAADWPRRQRLMSTMQLERDRRMQQSGYGRQVMRNALQVTQGSPITSGAADIGFLAGLAATDWSWSPLLADFDNDGLRDVFISSGIKRDMNDLDFFHYTADSINRTGGINPKRFANFEDFSRLMPSAPAHNCLYQNLGESRLGDVSAAAGFAQTGFSTGAAYADLDNDGDLDLITNNLESPPGIYENRSAAANWLQIKCHGTPQNPQGTGAKIRVFVGEKLVFTQEMTPVRGFYSSSEAIMQVGLGDAPQADRVEIDWMEGKHQVLQNVAARQRLTMDIAAAAPGHCPRKTRTETPVFRAEPAGLLAFSHVENAFEDFDREKLLPYRLSRTGPCMAVADLNGDGVEDLFLGGAAGQAGQLFLSQKGAISYAKSQQPALETDLRAEDCAAVFLDADGDGDLDLYVVSGGNEAPAGDAAYQDRLYLNDGAAHFQRAAEGVLPKETEPGSCVVTSDFNQDGSPDLLVGGGCVPGRYPEAARSLVLLNDGKGAFRAVDAPKFTQNGLCTDLTTADLDGDGRAEVLACGDWMPVSVWAWKEGTLIDETARYGLGQSHGWWNGLLAQDLDGDGDVDIAAGNEGLNTRLSAHPDAPLRLFAADFDKNGSMDPLLCVASAGAYRPVAQRDHLAAQMPVIRRKFARNATFAEAAITDVFSEKELLASNCLFANTLANGWFENQSGRFVWHEFPLAAQAAPVSCIVARDFTGDGLTDLLLLGNDRGAEPNTYHQMSSGGTLLRGLGRGGFEVQTGHGLSLWEEVRCAALIASGKRLVVGVNNGPCRVYTVGK
jgi:enediyne biosynthesis protein E4